MDGFSKDIEHNIFKKQYKILFIILLCLLIPVMVQAQGKGKVAVLPFRIDSLEPLDHLKMGLQTMLASLMTEKGYQVISPETVNKHPDVSSSPLETKEIIALGKDLGVDWIIHGNLTQMGERISLDLNVTDVSAVKAPFSIFRIEDSIDNLADAVIMSATSIDNRISGVLKIDMIKVKGNRRIETEAILSMIKSREGDTFDQGQLNQDLHSIHRTGYFSNVNYETEDGPNGKIVTFNVTERPIIIKISFEGNKRQKDDKLSEELGLKEYSIYNPSEVKQSRNRLKDFYRKKGYYNTEINDRIVELPNNEVSLTYVIDEGKKVYIKRIEFIGNEIYDDKDLKKIMETSEKGLFSWFTDAGILDHDKLEYDVFKITSLYSNNGYIRAQVGEPEIAYDEEEDGLIITITIIEGDQYKINNVRIEGDLIKPESELLDYVQIGKEEIFNREVMYNDIQALKDFYGNEGYAYAEVNPIPRQDNENDLVDIIYNIDKKKLVHFERINITGNTITRDKVIRRELEVVEGDVFSGEKLTRSTENLHRLGYSQEYFDDIEVNTRRGSQDDLIVLDISVKDRPTGSFNAGAGYSAFDRFIMSLGLSQENLFGRGQYLSLQAYLGSRTTEFNLSFTEPWLFDKDLISSINLYNWETNYDDYTKDSYGGSLSFGFLLGIDDYTRGLVGYFYDKAQLKYISPLAALIIQTMGGRNLTSSMTLGINRNSTDQPWNTTRGSINGLTMEYAGGFLGGDSYYTKYTGTSAWYFPLWWGTVLLTKVSAGYVTQRAGGRLPIYERFILGGIDSVRGYEWGDISPVDPATGGISGGEKMWLLKLEYRYPLLKEQGVWGLVFFDAGNSIEKGGDWKSGARRSVGFGVRWRSPMGNIRLEYGFKLDKRPGDTSGELEFGMGSNL